MAKQQKQPAKLYRVTVHTRPKIVQGSLSRFAAKRFEEMMRNRHPKAVISKEEISP